MGFDDLPDQPRSKNKRLENILENIEDLSDEEKSKIRSTLQKDQVPSRYKNTIKSLDDWTKRKKDETITSFDEFTEKLYKEREDKIEAKRPEQELNKKVHQFENIVEEYKRINPTEKSKLKNLEILADAAFLSTTDVNEYIIRIKEINTYYNKINLSRKNYNLIETIKYSTALGGIGTGIAYIGASFGIDPLMIAGGITAATSLFTLPIIESNFGKNIFRKRIKKHIDGEPRSLKCNLNQALKYANELYVQIKEPMGFNRKYNKRLEELDKRHRKGRNDLRKTIILLEKLGAIENDD